MKNSWKTIVIVLVVIVASGAGYYYYSSAQKAALQPQVRTTTLNKGKVTSAVSSTGSLKPVDKVDISSKITGRIVQLLVEENQRVHAGQTLVILDDFQMRSALEQTKARLDNATVRYERMKYLYDQDAIAKQEVDTVEMEYLVAKAAHEKSVADLNDTVITTAIDGEVIGKPIAVGQTVAPGISTPMVLMTIADINKMQIEALVDESDIGKIKVGQKAQFTVDSYSDEVFVGKVSLISRSAQTQQNVIYYTVYIDVSNEHKKLLPTMTARVNILIDEKDNVFYVPLTAIKDQDGKKYVQEVMDNNQQRDIEVKVGLLGDDRVEIMGEGLTVGMKLALKSRQSTANNNMRMPRI